MFFYQLKDPSWVIAHQKSGNFDCYPAKPPRRLFNVFCNGFTVYDCVIWHVIRFFMYMYSTHSCTGTRLKSNPYHASTCTKTQESMLISINSDTKKTGNNQLLIRLYCYCISTKGGWGEGSMWELMNWLMTAHKHLSDTN